jgi:nucleoid-associated protein YgaU
MQRKFTLLYCVGLPKTHHATRTWIVRPGTARTLMYMTRENKLALVVAFGLILLVGVLISDHFSTARHQESADLRRNRPNDPMVEQRRNDPLLLEVHASNERLQRETQRTLPLATNTTQMPANQESDSQASASPAITPTTSAAPPPVQQVIMGQPVNNGNGSSTRSNGNESTPVTFHNVQPGETLTAIARRYYDDATLVNQLATFNGLSDANALRVNHRLRIPAKEVLTGRPDSTSTTRSTPPAATPSTPAPQPTVYTTYTVKRGDTLSELSLQLLGTSRRWRELYELNKDVIRDPDNLHAGTELKVPRPG